MFKTHEENIPQILAVVDAFGTCYFHGCGNMYDNQKDSDDRKIYSNPGFNNTTPASAYRVVFTSKDQVPTNLEGLNSLLQKSFSDEQIQASKPKIISLVKTVAVSKPASGEASETSASNVPDDTGRQTGKKDKK